MRSRSWGPDADDAWTRDPAEFPTFRSLSAGMMFYRRVLVHHGPTPRLEFLKVKMPSPRDPAYNAVFVKLAQWNAQWEAGPYRVCDLEKMPPALEFLHQLEASGSEKPTSDIVLLAEFDRDIYDLWSPLYHLLPRSSLTRHGLPILGRGVWPMRGLAWSAGSLSASHYPSLARAFAEHLWKHGLGPSGSPLGAFSRHEPLVLLSHDLSYWRGHMERLIRRLHDSCGRVARDTDDVDPVSIVHGPDLTYEMPRKGAELWTGEDEASDVTCDLLEQADEGGRIRGVIDAIRSNRVQEDFSSRWSFAREDFERKLYKKRHKTRVSFIEFDDSMPFYDEHAELHGDLLYRDLLTMVDPKDRHVVVCFHSGMTNIAEVAQHLGYANHSPVSKALDRIRKQATRLLND